MKPAKSYQTLYYFWHFCTALCSCGCQVIPNFIKHRFAHYFEPNPAETINNQSYPGAPLANENCTNAENELEQRDGQTGQPNTEAGSGKDGAA